MNFPIARNAIRMIKRRITRPTTRSVNSCLFDLSYDHELSFNVDDEVEVAEEEEEEEEVKKVEDNSDIRGEYMFPLFSTVGVNWQIEFLISDGFQAGANSIVNNRYWYSVEL